MIQKSMIAAPKHNYRDLIILSLIGGILLPLVGCGGPTETAESRQAIQAKPVSRSQVAPDVFLSQVFARYHSATSYHDRAIATLSYSSGGKTESKSAPLHVWFDRNQLYVQAYDVKIFSDAEGMLAWIGDQPSNDFDSQVLKTGSTGRRPAIASLFSDPILRDQIAAGLAGPPPQLEWLFSTEPMQPLFRREHRFSFDRPESIGGRRCRIVRIVADREQYRFWIDEEFGIVRRIDFPLMTAPPVPGRPPLQMTLTMDLVDASFDASRRTPDVKPLPTEPKYVSRFIPLPPTALPKIIGQSPSSFRAQSADQSITISDDGSDRDVTIAFRYAGDERSNASIAVLQRWHAQMPKSLAPKVRLVVLSEPALAAQIAKQVSLPVVIDQQDAAARALDLAPGALTIQDDGGRIVWVQTDFSHAGMVSLGAIVADVIQGIDVPSRIAGQWKEQIDAYDEAIRKASVN